MAPRKKQHTVAEYVLMVRKLMTDGVRKKQADAVIFVANTYKLNARSLRQEMRRLRGVRDKDVKRPKLTLLTVKQENVLVSMLRLLSVRGMA